MTTPPSLSYDQLTDDVDDADTISSLLSAAFPPAPKAKLYRFFPSVLSNSISLFDSSHTLLSCLRVWGPSPSFVTVYTRTCTVRIHICIWNLSYLPLYSSWRCTESERTDARMTFARKKKMTLQVCVLSSIFITYTWISLRSRNDAHIRTQRDLRPFELCSPYNATHFLPIRLRKQKRHLNTLRLGF